MATFDAAAKIHHKLYLCHNDDSVSVELGG